MGWLHRYQRFWRERLDALAAFLDSLRRDAGAAKSAAGGADGDKRKS